MKEDEIEKIVAWVETYYRNIIRKAKIQGIPFAYYKSLRGYWKHATILNDILNDEFGAVDFKIWNRILLNIKSSRSPFESGGFFLKYKDYEDICSVRAYYKTRKKLLDLSLIVKTPFKGYYILNPRYVIKLYNPKLKKEEKEKED